MQKVLLCGACVVYVHTNRQAVREKLILTSALNPTLEEVVLLSHTAQTSLTDPYHKLVYFQVFVFIMDTH